MRRLSKMIWWMAILLLIVFLLLIGTNLLLRQGDNTEAVNHLINKYLPNVSIDYDSASFNISLQGVYFHVTDLSIQDDNQPVLRAANADLWLQQDALNIVLTEPDIYINNSAAAAGAWVDQYTIVVFAVNANIIVPHLSLTLDNTDIKLRHGDNHWQLMLSTDDERLQVEAAVNDAWQGNVYAEFSDWPAPSEWPLAWQSVHGTLWAQVDETITYAVAAVLNTVVTESMNAATVYSRLAGQWHPDDNSRFTTTIAIDSQRMRLSELVTINAGIAMTAVWQQHDNDWTLTSDQFSLSNDDAVVTANIVLSGQAEAITHIETSGEIAIIALTAVAHYLPAGLVKTWFNQSIRGGTLVGIDFYLQTDDVASLDNSTIRLTTAFVDGALYIEDGWPTVRALAGVWTINDDDMQLTGEGLLGDMAASDIWVNIASVNADAVTLQLNIQGIAAELTTYLAVAQQISLIAQPIRTVAESLSIQQGRAALSLALAIPLSTPENTEVNGQLELRYVAFEKTEKIPAISGIGGQVSIHQDTFTGQLTGYIVPDQNLPITATFTNTTLTVAGMTNISTILSVAAVSAIALTGTVNFQLIHTPTMTMFTIPLQGIIIDLPYPIGKGENGAATLQASLAGETTYITYTNDNITLQLLDSPRGIDVAINDDIRQSPSAGIDIHGQANDIFLNLWLKSIMSGSTDIDDSQQIQISLVLTDADFMGFNHSTLAIYSPPPSPDGRVLHLQSPHIVGLLTLQSHSLQGHFSTLDISSDSLTDGLGGDNQSLSISLTIAALYLNGKAVGAAEVIGGPGDDDTWQLSHLQINRNDITLQVAGIFDEAHTYLTITFNVPNLPELLSIFNVTNIIGGGRLSFFGNVDWPNSSGLFDLTKIKGNISLSAGDIYYQDVSPAVGLIRLLAIFSPQSLFSLGFTKLSPNIVFHNVQGGIVLKDGFAELDNMVMESEDIVIRIEGKTNFANRQHDLKGQVQPGDKLLQVGSAIGLGAGIVLLGPLSILASSLFGKIFSIPIKEIGTYDYTITGSWEKPIYTEVGVTRKQEERQ